MALRHLFAASVVCAGGLLTGCESGTTKDETTTEANRLEAVHRAAAGFDSAGRVFLRNGAPAMVTALHDEYIEEFISRPGFGGGRMVVMPIRPRTDWVELSADSQSERVSTKGPAEYNGPRETLKLSDGTSLTMHERVWLVRKNELMSVNAETGPAVYLIPSREQHEQMKAKPEFKGKTAPKRALGEFETAALAKLRDGEDVVIQEAEGELHVVGAIRARNECLSCHKDAQVGTMLGAFSYALVLQSEETPAADRLQDKAGLTQDELSAIAAIESTGGKVIRAAGGPVTELQLTYIRKKEYTATRRIWDAHVTHVALRDTNLNVLDVFPKLEVLDVSHSYITDAGLKEIAKLKHLKKVEISYTAITDEGLAQLKKALPKCEVVRAENIAVAP